MKKLILFGLFIATNLAAYPQDSVGVAYYYEAQRYSDQNSYGLALVSFSKAAEIFEKKAEREYLAYSRIGVGMVHESLGNYNLAVTLITQAREDLLLLGLTISATKALYPMALAHTRKGNYAYAIKTLKEYYKLIGHPRSQADALNLIGINFRKLEQFDSAITYHNRSILINAKLGNDSKIAKNVNNIGRVYFLRGEYTTSIRYHKMAIDIQKLYSDTLSLIMAYNRLGEVLISNNQPELAVTYLEEGRKIDFAHPKQIKKNRESLAKAYHDIKLQQLNSDVEGLNIKVLTLVMLWFVSILLVVIHIYKQRIRNAKMTTDVYKLEAESLLNKIEVTSGHLEWVNTLLGQAGFHVRTHKNAEAVSNVDEAQKIISDLTKINLQAPLADKTQSKLKSRKN